MARTPSLTRQLNEFHDARGDYSAARRSMYRRTRTGTLSGGSGADYHYGRGLDYWKIVEDSRDMDRNDGVIGQAISRAATNIVMDGFKCDPQTPDKGLNRDLALRWLNWAEDPHAADLAGENTFAETEWLACRHMLVDGDVFLLPHVDGGLQAIENHRCRTPRSTTKNVILGVLLNEQRQRVQFWFTREEVGVTASVAKVGDVVQYNARDEDGYRQVFQVYNPKRFSQTRGVGALAPVFDTAGMVEDIQFATMVKAQVASCFAIFRERELNFKFEHDDSAASQTGNRTIQYEEDGTARKYDGIGPGMDVRGKPGEKLHGFAPNIPNAEFFPHVRLMLTMVGINLGLPLFLVLMDPSEGNFSNWRGALDEAKKGFRRNQTSLSTRLHSPCYLWKVRQWLSKDPALRRALDKHQEQFYWHRWGKPRWPYIEPLKDAQAALLERRNGLTSPRRQHAERGEEFGDVKTEIIDDNGDAIIEAKTKAAAINKQFPDDGAPVTWRDVFPMPPADGGSFKADQAAAAEAASEQAANQPQPTKGKNQ